MATMATTATTATTMMTMTMMTTKTLNDCRQITVVRRTGWPIFGSSCEITANYGDNYVQFWFRSTSSTLSTPSTSSTSLSSTPTLLLSMSSAWSLLWWFISATSISFLKLCAVFGVLKVSKLAGSVLWSSVWEIQRYPGIVKLCLHQFSLLCKTLNFLCSIVKTHCWHMFEILSSVILRLIHYCSSQRWHQAWCSQASRYISIVAVQLTKSNHCW